MENEFILHICADQVDKKDLVIKELLLNGKMDISLKWQQIFAASNEAFYRIKISATSLIQLKKILDLTIEYTFLELFEFRCW